MLFRSSDWKNHVAETGVTCYTCHRGQPVPSQIWFTKADQPYGSNFMGDKAGQNTPDMTVNLSSLPNDPFTPFLLKAENIRVGGTTALPTGNRQSIKQAGEEADPAQQDLPPGTRQGEVVEAAGEQCTVLVEGELRALGPPGRLTGDAGAAAGRSLDEALIPLYEDSLP